MQLACASEPHPTSAYLAPPPPPPSVPAATWWPDRNMVGWGTQGWGLFQHARERFWRARKARTCSARKRADLRAADPAPPSPPRIASYNGLHRRRVAWEHALASSTNETTDGPKRAPWGRGVSQKKQCMSTGLAEPLYLP